MSEKAAKGSGAEAGEQAQKYTKYEIARMIGARALQISMGAPFQIKLDEEGIKKLRYNPVEIAKLEFEKGVIPITVRRPVQAKE
ncbi:DNA-directed RNA polymerase subunit K [Candidatus Woesearchaeota archaeon]|nr:DNA-directed RNA polymerase subunit K [Candidatus Woesearchaeota archaeon]